MNKQKSCITDKPVLSKQNDTLQAHDYALALSRFIQNADTPVTIGIQGGWGSGKTSLISILQELLKDDEEHKTLCVFVNAWEHSLFQEANSKAEVALSLLSGLTDEIKTSVENSPWIDKEISKQITKDNEIANKTLGALKLGLRIFARVGTQMVSNVAGTGDISGAFDAGEDEAVKAPMAQHVHDLRASLREQIECITKAGKPEKIVFFIDDLDRVPPATAVEILDITKNIFDIPNCIFILTIDYDVVVKGLEEKFGPKSRENEREFRHYFDKIIQIPFTMPIGAYSAHLTRMLSPALEQLGLKAQDDAGLMKRLADEAQIATGGIPRSIKRIVNTLSLLGYIAEASRQGSAESETEMVSDLEARFIIVALHINFPEICRRLMERSNFTKWTREELDKLWKLDSSKYESELAVLETDELFNDEWEKALYCLCGQSEWLKAQAKNISQLLNKLLVALNSHNGQINKGGELSEDGLTLLTNILGSIRVVSIDSETSTQSIDDSNVKNDRCTRFCRKLHEALAKALPDGAMDGPTKQHAKKYGKCRNYRADMNEGRELELEYCREGEGSFSITIWGDKKRVNRSEADGILSKYEKDYGYGQYQEFYFSLTYEKFSFDDFLKRSVDEFIPDTVTMYEQVIEAENALAEYKNKGKA